MAGLADIRLSIGNVSVASRAPDIAAETATGETAEEACIVPGRSAAASANAIVEAILIFIGHTSRVLKYRPYQV